MQTLIKPSKRYDALIKFSREHHYGLLLVWKIRRGIKNNIEAERIADYTLFFFEKDLKTHFKEEETILFTKLDSKNSMLKRALQEHRKIYTLINAIRADKNNFNLLNEFADTLEKHIRFEERELFNYLQNNLSETELIELAEKHRGKACDVSENWNDKFWN